METLIAPIRFKPVEKPPVTLAGAYVRMLRREDPASIDLGTIWDKGAIGVIVEVYGGIHMVDFDTLANRECEIFVKFVDGRAIWGAIRSDFEFVEPCDE